MDTILTPVGAAGAAMVVEGPALVVEGPALVVEGPALSTACVDGAKDSTGAVGAVLTVDFESVLFVLRSLSDSLNQPMDMSGGGVGIGG